MTEFRLVTAYVFSSQTYGNRNSFYQLITGDFHDNSNSLVYFQFEQTNSILKRNLGVIQTTVKESPFVFSVHAGNFFFLQCIAVIFYFWPKIHSEQCLFVFLRVLSEANSGRKKI